MKLFFDLSRAGHAIRFAGWDSKGNDLIVVRHDDIIASNMWQSKSYPSFTRAFVEHFFKTLIEPFGAQEAHKLLLGKVCKEISVQSQTAFLPGLISSFELKLLFDDEAYKLADSDLFLEVGMDLWGVRKDSNINIIAANPGCDCNSYSW